MPGQAYGAALASILLGETNPSGRCPLTMPNTENETQMTPEQYPGIDKESVYSEGLLVDYRWYNAKGVAPAYAFGHGLSYSSFEYNELTITPLKVSITEGQHQQEKGNIVATAAVSIKFKVKNTSQRQGRSCPIVLELS